MCCSVCLLAVAALMSALLLSVVYLLKLNFKPIFYKQSDIHGFATEIN